MVKFELGKEIEKYGFRLVTSMGQRDYGELGVYYEVHMTRVLHTARISNVDSVLFVNGIRKMVFISLPISKLIIFLKLHAF